MKEIIYRLIGALLILFFLLFLMTYDCFYFFIYPEFNYGSGRTLYLSIIQLVIVNIFCVLLIKLGLKLYKKNKFW